MHEKIYIMVYKWGIFTTPLVLIFLKRETLLFTGKEESGRKST